MFVKKWPAKFVDVQKAADDALMEQAERLATQMEPDVAKAVLAFLQAQGDQLDLEALVKALKEGDVDAVLALVANASSAAAASAGVGVAASLQNAAWAGGTMSAGAPVLREVQFVFNRLNPELVNWLRDYDLGMIQNISNQTKEAVRGVLKAGMEAGKGPMQQASQIKEVIGLTPGQANAVANFRKELETFHLKRSAAGWQLGGKPDQVNGHSVFKPTASGAPADGMTDRRLRDLRYDGQLQRALATRKPLKPEQIDKMVGAYRRKYILYRARTIARTESLRATNVGVQEAWRQAVVTGKVAEDLIRRFWIITADERVCPICRPIPHMNKGGVKLSEDFDTPDGPVTMGPLHVTCRCTIFIRTLEPGEITFKPGLPSALGRTLY